MSNVYFNFQDHLARQAAFSEHTFGPGARTKGVVDHIRKELTEIEADPGDLKEWIDVVILALDGAWRTGATPIQIIEALIAKQLKNESRVWPDWRTADPDKAIEHDRTADCRDTAQPRLFSNQTGQNSFLNGSAPAPYLIACRKYPASSPGIPACLSDCQCSQPIPWGAQPPSVTSVAIERDPNPERNLSFRGVSFEAHLRPEQNIQALRDIVAADLFVYAMKEKLAASRRKGRSGWEQCSADELSQMLREHVDKGDPVDVANFCMFLASLGYSIGPKTLDV